MHFAKLRERKVEIMKSIDGFTLYNSDTALGRALRKYCPEETISVQINIECEQPVTMVIKSLVPEELKNCEDWDEVLKDAEKIEGESG